MKKILFIGVIIALFLSAYGVAQAVPPNAGEIYELVGEWGVRGSENGQFWNPTGIAADSQGNVYVVDRDNHRIQTFTADGDFIGTWGWYGPLDGELRFPCGIAIDAENNIYITDKENYRVQKFTAEGEFVAKWGVEAPEPEDQGPCKPMKVPEGFTLEDGMVRLPDEIAVDLFGNVFVIDDYRIQKFSTSGQFLSVFDVVTPGKYRYGIATDASGNVYVIGHDCYSNTKELYHLIYKYDPNGQLITKWGSNESSGGDTEPPVGEFYDLSGIALDPEDNVYVVDRNYAEKTKVRIQKFTSIGQFLTEWTTDRKDIEDLEVASTGITVDKEGNVYLLNGNSVQKFAIAPPVTTTTTTSSIPGGTTTTTIPPPRTEPAASFTVKPVTATVSTPFTFDASGSSDKEDPTSALVVRWDWENDGTWDTDFSTNKIATHQYLKEGIYTIRLEVKDTSGLTDSATRRIIVWAQPRSCAVSYLLGKQNPRLGTLRKFRDTILAKSTVGIKLIEIYYKNGKRIVEILEKSPFLRESMRTALEKLLFY